MNLVLYISYDKGIKSLAELLGKTLDLFSENIRIHERTDYYYITDPNFTLHIYDDEELVSYIKEELKLDVNYCLDINVFSKSPDIGLGILFRGINDLRKIMEGDIALTDSESGIIFVRIGDNMIINLHFKENPDIYKWPYKLLDGPYQEENMEGLI